MKKISKILGVLTVVGILASCSARGPHQETWGAGKPRKNHMEKKKE